MPQLIEIRNALARLRRRRRLVRWGTAYAALAVVLLWILVVLFALDVAFHLNVFQRVTLLVVAVLCIVWGVVRFVLPFLNVRESETALALLVERQFGIDTDLVAALQFSRAEAANWGSPQLEAAIIGHVAERTPQLDVFRTIRYEHLTSRMKWLMVTVLTVAAVVAIYPAHVRIFLERLLLSTRLYPSRTNIELILVNGQIAYRSDPMNRTPTQVQAAEGRPVQFLVQVTGQSPERGSVECSSPQTADTRSLVLRKLGPAELERLKNVDHHSTQQVALGRATDARTQWFSASLPQMLEEFQYSIQLGDTQSGLGSVRMLALPVAEVDIQVTPPDYAQAIEFPSGSKRHVAVVEGSRVALSVRSANKKPFQDVSIRLTHGGQTTDEPLAKLDGNGLQWQLASANSPLERVEQELRYEIQVVDVDGLLLESPLQGMIQVIPDRLPTAFAETVHRVILPDARPAIEFRVSDDYGIQSIELQLQVQRQIAGGDEVTETAADTKHYGIPLKPSPLLGANVRHRGRFQLDLAPLQLAKGDRLKLTLQVTDYRGSLPGRSYLTEPFLLDVSDEAGVLSAITEVDEQSERRLTETIEQQLGVESAP